MTPQNKSGGFSQHYDLNYGNFQSQLYADIRRDAFGEDVGQNSWLTVQELDSFQGLLGLSSGKRLLDVACGSGGPALRMAARTGCSVVGIDVHQQAISTANELAGQRHLEKLAEFHVVNAKGPLSFTDASFDAISCIDAINHLPDRPEVLREWARLLKPGGRLLFTDPITVTGPLTKEEIAIRASIGFFLFVPRDYDERIIAGCGLRLIECQDLTANTAQIAEKRRAARELRSEALRRIESDSTYEAEQTFLSVAARLAAERRLSRFLYVSEKTS